VRKIFAQNFGLRGGLDPKWLGIKTRVLLARVCGKYWLQNLNRAKCPCTYRLFEPFQTIYRGLDFEKSSGVDYLSLKKPLLENLFYFITWYFHLFFLYCIFYHEMRVPILMPSITKLYYQPLNGNLKINRSIKKITRKLIMFYPQIFFPYLNFSRRSGLKNNSLSTNNFFSCRNFFFT
jgi:hypothetical protein